jgi:amino acid adenylation domain-containing protein
LFGEQAAATPDLVAIRDNGRVFTYAEVSRRASQLAEYLIQLGIGPEDTVAIATRRSADLIIATVAILKAGGSYVPLDAGYPASRLRMIVEDASVRVVLANAATAAAFEGTNAKVVVLDRAWKEIEGLPAIDLPSRTTPESRAYIMYTSGSTGVPKGVEVLHRGIVRLVRNTNYVSFGQNDVFGQISNPAFDASTFEIWGALLNGGSLVILPTETVLSPGQFASAIREHRISTMFLTASLFSVMAAVEPTAFGTMRFLVVGGDKVDPGAARKVLAAASPEHLVNGYGPTECTTFSVCHWIENVEETANSIPIGRPISNSEAYILDDDLQPVPVGVTGDLYLGGDGLARGYLNRPELTAERFISHPFDTTEGAKLYKTGDRAQFLDDGLIDFLGRKDHQVKFHGFRIELGEIEVALRKYPGVIDAVVVVWQPSENDKRLVGYMAASPEQKIQEAQVRQQLLESLPEYMVPSHVVVLPALPLNAVGKIDRTALPPPNQRAFKDSVDMPMEYLEGQIAKIWKNTLSLPSVGLDDNFFDLGGTSLTLAFVESQLREITAKSFAVTDLFRYTTIRTLAEFFGKEPAQDRWLSDARSRAMKQRASLKHSRLAR